MKFTRRNLLLGGLSIGAASLGVTPRLAFPNSPGADLIVLIPGILGSVLSINGKDVWAPSARALSRALVTLGGSAHDLTLHSDGSTVDGVRAARLVDDVHLIPGLWKIDGYSKIQKTLLNLPGVTLGENFFTFPYDWRLDNRIAAKAFAQIAPIWLSKWRKRSGNPNAKLILLGHSMGGLISRYYLECLGGWQVTKFLVTFGTPYRGSLDALHTLISGTHIRVGNVELADLSPFTRSLTSVYQLLPTYACIELQKGKLVRIAEAASLPNVVKGRVSDAQAFHVEIATAVASNRKDAKYLEGGYQIVPIVGTNQPTLQAARLSMTNDVEFLGQFPGQSIDGDGTVPRPSATPPEFSGSNREIFVSELHASLQNSPSVLQQLSGLISGQTIDWNAFRAPQRSLSLQVPTISSSRQSIEVQGTYGGVAGKPETHVVVQDAATGTDVASVPCVARLGKLSGTIPPLPDGTYRITMTMQDMGGLETQSVTDVCVVIDPATIPR